MIHDALLAYGWLWLLATLVAVAIVAAVFATSAAARATIDQLIDAMDLHEELGPAPALEGRNGAETTPPQQRTERGIA